MEKEYYLIQMEILYMMVIGLMEKKKEMENIFLKMANAISVNLKMIYKMEKEYYSIQMKILNMMVIGWMIKEKEMENIFLKMVIII